MKNIINIFITLIFFTSCSQNHSKPLIYPELTNDGVNSLNSKTLYEKRFIAPKLLGYKINEFTTFKNGDTFNVMRVHFHNKEIMIITPTAMDNSSKRYIKNIIITSNFVKNPFNLKIDDLYKKDEFSNCQKSKQNLICKKDGYNKIKIIFSKNSNNRYILKEFIWNKND